MRLHRFNKDKALRKIHFKQNKNKYIKALTLVLSIIVLVFFIVYFSFSQFSTSNKFNVIQTTVGDFSSGDYAIAAYIDGTKTSDFPAQNAGYSVDKIECTNSATATWNYSDWAIYVKGATSTGTKCNVYFVKKTTYTDGTGANVPELYQGLIPVTISTGGVIQVADTSKEWYNYASHNWANAVLVNCSDATIKAKYFDDNMKIKDSIIGQTVTPTDILQMYVWIPRYKYLLWNAENGSSNPQAISITFESNAASKSNGSTNGTWLTHPAFTFGTTELNGIWVGKFENSGTTSALTIKPDVTSLRNITVGNMFNASRNQELTYASNYGISSSEVDTHIMKNMDWGATAYLSSSIYGRYNADKTCIASGCEIVINNNSSFTTGCSSSGCGWSTNGVSASTTGNVYGIYDMSGGAWEYVMGNMVDASGNYYPSSSGLTKPDNKYFDSYAYSASTYTDHARGHLGDATKETLKAFGSETGGWYSDYAYLPSGVPSWFARGGPYNNGAGAGAFYFARGTGEAYGDGGFRSVLSAQ
jgi:hypothetical protein